jgi:cobalamin biosynthesis protein CbiG
MGQITINVPTNINLNFEATKIQAKRISNDIQNLGLIEIEDSAIEPPRRNSLRKDLQAACGIWANRKETGEEISMAIRKANRRQ